MTAPHVPIALSFHKGSINAHRKMIGIIGMRLGMIHFLAQLSLDGAADPQRSIAGRHWGNTARSW
jgi:hypothetical protein